MILHFRNNFFLMFLTGVATSRRPHQKTCLHDLRLQPRDGRPPPHQRPQLLREEPHDGPEEGHQSSIPHRVPPDRRRGLLPRRRRPGRDLRKDESSGSDAERVARTKAQGSHLQSDDQNARHHSGLLPSQGKRILSILLINVLMSNQCTGRALEFFQFY